MQLGTSISMSRRMGNIRSLASAVKSLFSNNEQGVWYDPSDFSTMFQDAAGTIPVTAVEQPVGKILDKSGKGNHATQTTSTARPILKARVNLLPNTQVFSSANVYNLRNTSVTSTSILAPDGTNTATEFTCTGTDPALQLTSSSWQITNYKYVVWLKVPSGTQTCHTGFKNGIGQGLSVLLTDQWQKFEVPCSADLSNGTFHLFGGYVSLPNNAVIHIWHPDLRLASDAIGIPEYQRVTSATNYDTVGFPHYLAFDGIDDSMQTANVDFTSTDKVNVFAGVMHGSVDVNVKIIFELSSDVSSNNGSLIFYSRDIFVFGSKGTQRWDANSNPVAAYAKDTLIGVSDIYGDVVKLKVDNGNYVINTGNQGTGNYGNYPLYIGSRAGNSLRFNGRLYSLIIRGALSSDSQIASVEKYVNSKTKAY
jgi:hypothetical protein